MYLPAFLFILVADTIGQIKIPVWKGTFIIFPIFCALFLGILTGPNILKSLDNKKVRAASGLVGMAIFIGIPLCNCLCRKPEPTLGRVTKAGRKAAGQAEACPASAGPGASSSTRPAGRSVKRWG